MVSETPSHPFCDAKTLWQICQTLEFIRLTPSHIQYVKVGKIFGLGEVFLALLVVFCLLMHIKNLLFTCYENIE